MIPWLHAYPYHLAKASWKLRDCALFGQQLLPPFPASDHVGIACKSATRCVYNMCFAPLLQYISRYTRPRPSTMGNSNSSQSLGSARSSRILTRREGGENKHRMSQAISFYQTPPGSLDLRELEQGGSTPRSPSSSNRSSKVVSPTAIGKKEVASADLPPKVWRAGVYSLINSGSGTVIDLSGGDQRSIIGFPAHHGPNQQVSHVTVRASR